MRGKIMKSVKNLKILWLAIMFALFAAMAIVAQPLSASAEEQTGVNFEEEDVIKVINVTDSSYRLESDEYQIEDGQLVVDANYLRTLEAGTKYTFRVITADGETDVEVQTDFTSATVRAEKEGFVRGEEISFMLGENVIIYRAEIDGKQVDFSREGNRVIVADDGQMVAGDHTLKLYTSKGRPSVTFAFSGLGDDIWNEIVPINYTWFIIDMCIFGGAILAYLTVVIIKKTRRVKAR